MKPFWNALIVAVCTLGVIAADAASPKIVTHPFLCADYGGNKIAEVSADGTVKWEFPVDVPQDVWRLPNGHVLFSHARGAKEIDPVTKAVVWEYKAPEGAEIHNCQPIPGNRVMIAECGTKRIIEVDRAGKIVKEIPFVTTSGDTHHHVRIARKLKNGNYLLSLNAERVVKELDPTGKELRVIKVDGDPYCALRLPNGNTLIGAGDGHKIIEVDSKDNIVWSVNENDIPGHTLRFVADLQRLPNGNTVICNWQGHGHVHEQSQIFEITRDKKVVWEMNDNDHFTTISGVMLLDVNGDVTKGQIIR